MATMGVTWLNERYCFQGICRQRQDCSYSERGVAEQCHVTRGDQSPFADLKCFCVQIVKSLYDAMETKLYCCCCCCVYAEISQGHLETKLGLDDVILLLTLLKCRLLSRATTISCFTA